MVLIKTLLKALLSLILLAYLIYIADPEQIIRELSNILNDGGIIYLFVATLTFLFSLLIYSLRWWILILGYGIKISIFTLYKFYLIGLFFNNFLPTGIGGDILRIHNLIQDTGERTIGFASVITERIIGVVSTLLLTLFSIFILFQDMENLILLYIAVSLLLLIVIFFVIIFNESLLSIITNFLSPLKFFRLGERINKFLDAIHYYKDKKIIYLQILIISIFAQSLVISMTYLLVLALKIDVAPSYLFLVVPISILLAILPSINGIGFRDGGFVVLLGNVGISKAAALSLSFLSIFIPIIVSTLGGLLFFMQKKNTKLEEIEVVEKSL